MTDLEIAKVIGGHVGIIGPRHAENQQLKRSAEAVVNP
jgi:hypothetical protein